MKKMILTAAVASILPLSACSTYNDPYRTQSTQASRAATGAAVGAVVGGVAGAVIPGVSVATGAIAGGIAGAVLGAVVNGRQYYRDTRGYCYYVDQYGRPIYDYNTRC
jgi:uncharacterized protein YcfJ